MLAQTGMLAVDQVNAMNTGSTGRRSDAWLVGAKVFLPKVVWCDRVHLCRHNG